MIPIYQPYLPKSCLRYAHDALDSTWISSIGVYLDKAKDKLKEIIPSRFVILVNNGTCATHLLAIGLKYKFPEIKKLIVPNNVYVAAWNGFLYQKDYTFEVIDADIDTWNFDHASIKSIEKDTALLAVHNLGNIINIPAIKRRFGYVVILEDNCEGLFGKHEGSYSGTQSLISSMSFFGNKTITSGEGGAIFTDDEDLFHYLNSVKGQGMSSTRYLHDKLGYNYRMTNVQAAILFGQLEIVDEICERKAEIFRTYEKELQSVDNIKLQRVEQGTEHAQWMFAVRFEGFDRATKMALELFLFENKIETRPMFYPINQHEYLNKITCETKIAAQLNHQCLILPSFPELTKGQIILICSLIKGFVKKVAKNNDVHK